MAALEHPARGVNQAEFDCGEKGCRWTRIDNLASDFEYGSTVRKAVKAACDFEPERRVRAQKGWEGY